MIIHFNLVRLIPMLPWKTSIGGMLTGSEIDAEISSKGLAITPYNRKNLNPNSYNLHCGNIVTLYHVTSHIDLMEPESYAVTESLIVSDDGLVLRPGLLYLMPTVETIRSEKYIPLITGRSSIGRLGVSIHQEAGFGDIGFAGKFTLQVKVTYPTKIYPGLPIAQVYFITPYGKVDRLYCGKYQHSNEAVTSRFNPDE